MTARVIDAGVARPALRTSVIRGWTLLEYDCVDSTNMVAAGLPAWHAVLSETQRGGRGRFERAWVSNAGGLWLSAVLPLGASQDGNQLLPLVAGLSAIEALERHGAKGLRLRWPNDVMAGDRKIAGILVERFTQRTAVVGIGVNVTNQPAEQDRSLWRTATRMAELVHPPPTVYALCLSLLDVLRAESDVLSGAGFAALSPRINGVWGGRRRVRLDVEKGQRLGTFVGIDPSGNLLLEEDGAGTRAFAPHEVSLLREV